MVPRRDLGARLLSSATPSVGEARSGCSRIVFVHPGILPVTAYDTITGALPADCQADVANLDAVADYVAPAMTGESPKTTITDIAARLATELHAAGLLDGAWHLAGWSFGGIIAYALAAQLAAAELPAQLILLDTPAPVRANMWHGDRIVVDLALNWFAMYLAARRRAESPLRRTNFAGMDTDAGLELILRTRTERGPLLPNATLPGARKLFEVYANGLLRNNRLATVYRAAPPRVPVTLVRPQHGLLTSDTRMGWQELDPDVEVRHARGDHYSILHEPETVGYITEAVSRSRADVS